MGTLPWNPVIYQLNHFLKENGHYVFNCFPIPKALQYVPFVSVTCSIQLDAVSCVYL